MGSLLPWWRTVTLTDSEPQFGLDISSNPEAVCPGQNLAVVFYRFIVVVGACDRCSSCWWVHLPSADRDRPRERSAMGEDRQLRPDIQPASQLASCGTTVHISSHTLSGVDHSDACLLPASEDCLHYPIPLCSLLLRS